MVLSHRHVGNHGAAPCPRALEDIRKNAPNDGERGRGTRSTDQTKDEQTWPVRSQCACHGENKENVERPETHSPSPVSLAQRPEDQWAEDISDQVDRGRHVHLYVTVDVEIPEDFGHCVANWG